MLDLNAHPHLRRLYRIARLRVSIGFVVAVFALLLARPTWLSITTGGVIAALGEGIRVWAAGHLEKGREVTRSGPYRLMRHPLYVGSFVIGIGFTIAFASGVATAAVVTYLVVMLVVAIRLEEATLRDAFGEEYDRYTRGVLPVSERRFSVERVLANREHHAWLGFAAALVILWTKIK